jgi:hypothetical protein
MDSRLRGNDGCISRFCFPADLPGDKFHGNGEWAGFGFLMWSCG